MTDLSSALRADMAAIGETREQYARRRGISKRTLDTWMDRPSRSPIAALLAAEIMDRLGR